MFGWLLVLLGLGAVAAVVAAAVIGGLLLGPLLVWLAWNVLGLAHAVGAGELGFWGLVLTALFLAVGLAGRIIIVAAVFLVNPSWFHHSAHLHWPAPTLRNFIAVCLLLIVAGISSHSSGAAHRRQSRPKPWPDD
jgi:hypothetical protein